MDHRLTKVVGVSLCVFRAPFSGTKNLLPRNYVERVFALVSALFSKIVEPVSALNPFPERMDTLPGLNKAKAMMQVGLIFFNSRTDMVRS
jgi:hypothetical protein